MASFSTVATASFSSVADRWITEWARVDRRGGGTVQPPRERRLDDAAQLSQAVNGARLGADHRLASTRCAETWHVLPVGFFGECLLQDLVWTKTDLEDSLLEPPREPWMSLIIHDSDLAILAYAPAGSGSGLAYIGGTPRLVFDDDSEAASPDRLAEAAALAVWVASLTNQNEADLDSLQLTIASFLASDDDPALPDDVTDEAEIFAENKVRWMLEAVSLPAPADLPD